jgi:hypothetical protein
MQLFLGVLWFCRGKVGHLDAKYPYDETTLISRRNTFFPATSPRLVIPIGCFQIRLRRITTATIKALTCFWISDLWPEIQATRFAGGR